MTKFKKISALALIVFTVVILLSVGLTACNWKQVTIMLDCDGGFLGEDASVSLDVKTGEKTDLSAYVPEKDGYVFDGWFVDGERVYDPTAYENTGAAIEAEWKKIISVVYVTGGAENAASNKSALTEGETLVLADLGSFGGKTFGGWYDAEGNLVTQIVADRDVVLYAIFY